jgi:hypothetical protein
MRWPPAVAHKKLRQLTMENKTLRQQIVEFLERNIQFRELYSLKDIDYNNDREKEIVQDELKDHVTYSSFSNLLLNQLAELHGRGYVTISGIRYPYILKSIYWILENIDKGKTNPVPFERKESKLSNLQLFHVENCKSFCMEDNQLRYFKYKYPDDNTILTRRDELLALYPDKDPIYSIVYECFNESQDWEKKTAEWILFQCIQNEIHFVGLGLHHQDDINDDVLFREINRYLL